MRYQLNLPILLKDFNIRGKLTQWSRIIYSALNRALRPAGIQIIRPRFEPWVTRIIEETRPFTMTGSERISSLCHAARYVVKSKIPGDVVECGVWRGGSMMAAAMTLVVERDVSRTLYL